MYMYIKLFSAVIKVTIFSAPVINACSVRDISAGEKCCTHFYKVNNTCQACLPGYFGDQCRFACVYPYFGSRCLEKCNCSLEYCNNKDGCIVISENEENLTSSSNFPSEPKYISGIGVEISTSYNEIPTASSQYSSTTKNHSENWTDDNGNNFIYTESFIFTIVIWSGIVILSVILFIILRVIIKCKRKYVVQSSNEASSDIYMDILDNILVETFEDSTSYNMHLDMYDDSNAVHVREINITLDENEPTVSHREPDFPQIKSLEEECEKYIYSEVVKNKTTNAVFTSEMREVMSDNKEKEVSVKAEIEINEECTQNSHDKPHELISEDTLVQVCFDINKFTESTKL